MKKTTAQLIALILLCLAIGCSDSLFAQNATKDANGNFHAISRSSVNSATAVNTGKTYTDTKGTQYSVFVSAKGKEFIIRTAKTSGKQYKMYLKL